MATSKRNKNVALVQPPLEEVLFEKPYEFEFYQAIRLLHRLYPDRAPLGTSVDPISEIAWIKSAIQLAPSASDIFTLEHEDTSKPPVITVNFFGIAGHGGPLPDAYTEMVLERIFRQDFAFRDFLDVFNHRLVSLSFRIAAKFQFFINFQPLDTQPISQIFYAIAGFNASRQEYYQQYPVPPRAYLNYASFFWRQARSLVGLRVILRDYFQLPIDIEEFIGMWLPIDEDQRTMIGGENPQNDMLGVSASLGYRTWVQSKKIYISIQDLDLETFQALLPGGTLNRKLRQLISSYLPNHIRFGFKLKLAPPQTPQVSLDGSARLGWTSWTLGTQAVGESVWIHVP